MNPSPQHQRMWVACLAAATALSASANAVVPVALPEIASTFNAPISAAAWVMTGFSGTCAMAFALTDWMARRFGETRLQAFSLLVFTLASLMCGLAPDLPSLLFSALSRASSQAPSFPWGTACCWPHSPHRGPARQRPSGPAPP